MHLEVSQPRESGLKCGGTAVDTSVSLARWKQGEQAMTGVDFVF